MAYGDYGSIGAFGMANPSFTPGMGGGAFGAYGIDGFSPPAATPGAFGAYGVPGGLGSQNGFGFNMPTFNAGINTIGTIGNLWGSWQANKLARDQFKFTKDITQKNLANSIQSYNTSLNDKARARGATEGQTPEQIQAYIDQNQLANK